MEYRNERIENELEQLKQQSNLEVILCQPDDIIRLDFWIVWVHGRQGTPFQKGVYPVKITFPQNYPMQPPIVQFQKQFLHVHVYEGGLICLPLLQQVNWKAKIAMLSIIQRIDSLIHQEINPYSPANMSLFEIFKSKPQSYEQVLKQQAQKYKTKNLKYFKSPCVHIEVFPQSK